MATLFYRFQISLRLELTVLLVVLVLQHRAVRRNTEPARHLFRPLLRLLLIAGSGSAVRGSRFALRSFRDSRRSPTAYTPSIGLPGIGHVLHMFATVVYSYILSPIASPVHAWLILLLNDYRAGDSSVRAAAYVFAALGVSVDFGIVVREPLPVRSTVDLAHEAGYVRDQRLVALPDLRGQWFRCIASAMS